MWMTKRLFVALVALALSVGVSQLAAQQEAALAADGELLWVDMEAETFAIRGMDEAELQFRYDDQTEVTGAQETIAGLAGEAGARVTVHFEAEGEVARATRIELHAEP